MSEWQSIETAPRDGTAVLVGRPGAKTEMAWWEQSVWFRGWVTGGHRSDTYGPSFEPTHWMPLPPPPQPS